jgi:potassium/chloride transporter 8
LHALGFAECVHGLFVSHHVWNLFGYTRQAIAVFILLLLLAINLSGIKWVIRLQFILLLVILASVLDFSAGVFSTLFFPPSLDSISTPDSINSTVSTLIHFDWDQFKDLLWSNPDNHVTWFQALGVFYPAVTGVFAGLNMSTDLRQPSKSVPLGTYSALAAAVSVYLLLLFGLTSVCPRYLLLTDQLVVQKVSLVRWFLLLGIYISTVSSSLGKKRNILKMLQEFKRIFIKGTMFGIPRIIQNMASEQILPFSNTLSKVHGESRVPIAALLVFSVVSLAFILSADFNQIAIIVTVTVLFTYALVEYAYFCLTFTLRLQRRQDSESALTRSYSTQESLTSSIMENHEYGACEKVCNRIALS